MSYFSKIYQLIQPSSIKGKFFAIILPPVLFSFFLVSILASVFAYFDEEKEIQDHFRENMNSYVQPIGLSLWNLNHIVLDSQLKSMLNNPKISGVRVVEHLSEQTFESGDTPKQGQESQYLVSEMKIEFISGESAEIIGILYLYTKKTQIFEDLIKRFFSRLFSVSYACCYDCNRCLVCQ
jgi:hypothetical protein